jgi:hypothetical protein
MRSSFSFLFRGSVGALVGLSPLLLLDNILQVAHIKAQQEKFDEAQQIYEEVATRMAEKWVSGESLCGTFYVGGKHCFAPSPFNHLPRSKLLKYGAKEYFLKASLCRLCLGDAIATKVRAPGGQRLLRAYAPSCVIASFQRLTRVRFGIFFS